MLPPTPQDSHNWANGSILTRTEVSKGVIHETNLNDPNLYILHREGATTLRLVAVEKP